MDRSNYAGLIIYAAWENNLTLAKTMLILQCNGVMICKDAIIKAWVRFDELRDSSY